MWLLVGGDSEIGATTYRYLKTRNIPAAATTRRRENVDSNRPFLNFGDSIADWRPPNGTDAACIFAAIARLNICAADPIGSANINVTQTLSLIERLLADNIYVLFLSTNQVFDGTKPMMKVNAALSPVSEYGQQKAKVESQLHRYVNRGAPISVLRLTKVLSPRMPLLRGWIEKLSANAPIAAFHDMMLAPVPTSLVVQTINSLMASRITGIFQLSGERDVSYADVGRHLAERLSVDPALVVETSAADNGQPAGATPRFTSLDSTILCKRLGLKVPEVWDAIATASASPSGKI